MTGLRLVLLGTPEAYGSAGRALAFPTRKTLALLVYLARNPGPQAREALLALLWPAAPPARGRGALRTTLAYLRQALARAGLDPAAFVQGDNDTLGLARAAPVETDTGDLEAALAAGDRAGLTGAVAAYRGDFLAGFSLADAPDFDEWAGRQREYWHEQMSRALAALGAHLGAAGEWAATAAVARRAIVHDPLREAAHRQLIESLYLAGDRAGALVAYQAARQLLQAQLGLAPGPETETLVARIRRAPAVPAASGRLRPDLARPAALPFAGRGAEYACLRAAYAAVQAGHPRLVVIEGEAGIGKTRLVEEFLPWAMLEGATILRGRAAETGGRLPYQPLVEALRVQIEQENAPADLLDDVWLAELGRLLPDLRERYPDLPAPLADESTARSRLFEAVARLLQALAAPAPLVVFLDDLQWTDVASRDLLHYGARRAADAAVPLLVLLTLRSEARAAGPALAEWLAAMDRVLPATLLPLAPLSRVETQQIIRTLAGPADKAATFGGWLFDETAGQPFFISETIKMLLDQHALALQATAAGGWTVDFSGWLARRGLMPPGVRQVILARLAPLSPAAGQLLAAAAVIGRGAEFEVLAPLAALGEEEGLRALDEVLQGRLLVAAGADRYAFAHDKIRAVVYDAAGAARRRVYHRRALGLLEARRRPAAELAYQALAAELPGPAFVYSLAAGEVAMDLFALPDALAQYEQAARLAEATPPEARPAEITAGLPRLYRQLGRTYELTGAFPRAEAVYQQLLTHARASGTAPDEAAALSRLATLAAQQAFDLPRAAALLAEAHAVATRAGAGPGLAEIEWSLAQIGIYQADPETALAHGQAALALARRADLRELVARCLNVIATAETGTAAWPAAEAHAAQAVAYYQARRNRAMEADSLSLVAQARLNYGDAPGAVAAGQAALAISREIDNRWGIAASAFHLALALLDTGALTAARACAEEGVAAARLSGVGI